MIQTRMNSHFFNPKWKTFLNDSVTVELKYRYISITQQSSQ